MTDAEKIRFIAEHSPDKAKQATYGDLAKNLDAVGNDRAEASPYEPIPLAEPPPEKIGRGEAALRAGAEGILPGSATTGLATIKHPSGSGMARGAAYGMRALSPALTPEARKFQDEVVAAQDAKAPEYEQQLAEERGKLGEAYHEYPIQSGLVNGAAFIAGPLGKAARAAKGGKAALAAIGAIKGGADAASMGGSARDIATNGAIGGAANYLAPFLKIHPVAAGPLTAGITQEASSLLNEGRPSTAKELESATLTALIMNAFGTGGRKVSEAIRDPKTKVGRNIIAAEETPGVGVAKLGGIDGPALKDVPEGDFGMGVASDKVAERFINKTERQRAALNKAFGQNEEALIKHSPDVKQTAEPILRTLDKAIAAKTLDDGTPISDEDVGKLSKLRSKFVNAQEVDGDLIQAPKVLSTRELVAIRREMDQLGHAGRVAGQDDVPYRAVASLVRNELIPRANPELAELMSSHHEALSKLEQAHGALVLREEAALPDKQNLTERASRRIAAYGKSDEAGASRMRALDKAMKNVDELQTSGGTFGERLSRNEKITPEIKRVRALRAREETRGGADPLQSAHGNTPAAQAVSGGLFSPANRAAVKVRAYAAGRDVAPLEHVPGALFVTQPRRKKKDTKE